MAMMFRSVDLFVLSCLLVTVDSHTDQVLPPQNVSLRWISDFKPQLSWAPPQHSMENCSYEVKSRTNGENSETYDEGPPPWNQTVVMKGGYLHLSVNTVCDGRSSEPVVINITDPVLVRDLQCSIHTSKHTHCSWEPASDTPDLRFFFMLVEEDLNGGHSSTPLQNCPLYSYRDGVRTGCDLQAKITDDVYIVFNEVRNSKLIRNTFKEELKVRPPPPEWTVTKTTDQFLISWIPPDIADVSEWKFTINYKECNEMKHKTEEGVTSTKLVRLPRCQYRMKIRAELITSGELTQWSDKEEYFDADPNVMMYVAVIIPLMFAGLAALTLVCCRKNKHIIFPKIPEVPPDLLSSISDNNNKSTVCNQYIQVKEEDTCLITVVTES